MKSNFWESVQHGLVAAALVALPLVYNLAMSKWGDITLGTIFTVAYHFLYAKYGQPTNGTSTQS